MAKIKIPAVVPPLPRKESLDRHIPAAAAATLRTLMTSPQTKTPSKLCSTSRAKIRNSAIPVGYAGAHSDM